MSIKILRARIIRVILGYSGKRYKVFQISSGKDGSIYLNCPYLPNTVYKASIIEFPAGVGQLDQVKIPDSKNSFKTDKKIKLSYHPSGTVRVSPIAKGDSFISYETTPIAEYVGHFATFIIGRIELFEEKSSSKSSSGKATHNYQLDFSDALPDHIHMPMFAGSDKSIFGHELALNGDPLKEKEIAVVEQFASNGRRLSIIFGIFTPNKSLKQDIKWYRLDFDWQRPFDTDGKAFFTLQSGFKELKTVEKDGKLLIIHGTLENGR